MSNATRTYFAQLSHEGGSAWNRFWFEPSHPATLSALRIVAGLATLYYLLTGATELITLFAEGGLLPNDTLIQEFQGRAADPNFPLPNYRFSALYYLNEPTMLWLFHGISLVVAAMFTVGLFSRVTNVLSLLIMLSWVHRAPMLTWQFEPVLTMLLLYLCLAPTGACLSLDSRRKEGPPAFSWAATISIRLIQIHVCLFYLMFALTKLGGQVWWSGNAMYILMAQSESRLIDLTFLRESDFALNLLTHAVVATELVYGVLIWNRLLRPLLMVVSALLWIGIALVTGLVDFALLMLALNLAFAPARWLMSREPSSSS